MQSPIANLVALYERLGASDDPALRLPQPGWQEREIAFVIELDPAGKPVLVLPLRTPQEKGRPRGRMCLVPQEAKRPGKIPDEATEADCGKASLFWDNPKYALGLTAEEDAKAARQAQVCHGLFRLRHAQFARHIADIAADDGMRALLRFLDRGAAVTLAAEDVAAIRESGGNIAFRLHGDLDLICRRRAIRDAISAQAVGDDGDGTTGQCLVTGRVGRIARLHPAIQGVAGAQTSGANIVSFNLPAFESYGLLQGDNAPVGTYAAFAYTTALNWLLRAGSPFRARAGGTTIVYWAGAATPNEAAICSVMAAVTQDDPLRDSESVKRVFDAPRSGVLPLLDDATPFFILALSAESKSRLSVRFFHAGTIADAARSIVRWFDQSAIAPQDGPPLSLMRLLSGLSVQGDLKNVPPLLAAELLRAVYTDTNLPQRVLAEALARCVAERGPTRERAALIKAHLMRNQGRRITVARDPDEPDPAYRLGRLFAVLEWVQERATNAKAGIAERFWGAATTTPAFVFPELLKLAVFHLDKLDGMPPPWPAFATNRRKEIEAIAFGLPPRLPPRLELTAQGSFAIGYWHERAARRSAADPAITSEPVEEQVA